MGMMRKLLDLMKQPILSGFTFKILHSQELMIALKDDYILISDSCTVSPTLFDISSSLGIRTGFVIAYMRVSDSLN